MKSPTQENGSIHKCYASDAEGEDLTGFAHSTGPFFLQAAQVRGERGCSATPEKGDHMPGNGLVGWDHCMAALLASRPQVKSLTSSTRRERETSFGEIRSRKLFPPRPPSASISARTLLRSKEAGTRGYTKTHYYSWDK